MKLIDGTNAMSVSHATMKAKLSPESRARAAARSEQLIAEEEARRPTHTRVGDLTDFSEPSVPKRARRRRPVSDRDDKAAA